MLQVKIYSVDGTLIDAISPGLLIGGISWSASIDGGQGEARIRLNMPISSAITGRVIKIFSTDVYDPTWKCVYTGIISKISRVIEKTEYIEISALGLATVLSYVLYSGSFNTTLNNVLSTLITEANAKYPFFSQDIESVSSMSIFSTWNKTILENIWLIKKIGYSWFVDGEGTFRWKNKTNQTKHIFTLGSTIEKISITDDFDEVKNSILLQYSSGTVTSTDSQSILDNWLRKSFVEKTDIWGSTYAQSFSDSLIEWPLQTLTLSVYDYDIYSIHPGHRVSIKNTPISIEERQIYKVNYWNNTATLEVEKIDSISHALRN